MRFGYWRGVTLAVALISAMATAHTASADGFHDTIPREVLARDLNTGGVYMAPPIPWGHYAKDGLFDHYFPKACPLCGLLGKHANGCGLLGHGHGTGCGKGGCGLFNHGCKGGCGKSGCGLFNHGCKGDPGCGLGHGSRVKDCGLCKNKGCGLCKSSQCGDPIFVAASPQSPARVAPAPQSYASAPMASPQCGDPGCGLGKGHHGLHGSICDGCTGKGCGKCGGKGLLGGHGCGSCGGKGCGSCGLFNKGACDGCGGKGCGKCGLFNKGGCSHCGGKGCGFCQNLKGKLYGLLHPHAGDIKWFVGPGGPVPLTPGYTPYIVTTRSPRDFLAFPPYTPTEF